MLICYSPHQRHSFDFISLSRSPKLIYPSALLWRKVVADHQIKRLTAIFIGLNIAFTAQKSFEIPRIPPSLASTYTSFYSRQEMPFFWFHNFSFTLSIRCAVLKLKLFLRVELSIALLLWRRHIYRSIAVKKCLSFDFIYVIYPLRCSKVKALSACRVQTPSRCPPLSLASTYTSFYSRKPFFWFHLRYLSVALF